MRYFLKKAGITLGGLFLFVFLSFQLAFVTYNENIFSFSKDLPAIETAVVFGGGMLDADTMTDMQEDRVRRAAELYKAGKAQRILFTGDDGGNKYDEVHAMEALAIDLGVSKNSIDIDHHGYRTYESCYRLANVYRIEEMIAVSQSFHLPRIRYICEKMGIRTIGMDADIRDYGWQETRADIREFLAKVKALWQVEVTKPLPRTLEK